MSISPNNATGPLAYRAAHWLYEDMPKGVAAKATGAASCLGFKAPTAKAVGSFMKQQFDNDFREFAKAEAGGWFKTLIAEPPRGALLFLLYPCTVGPRLYRAWQRGRKENDYREMGDVLRRDLTAITFFVFALSPIVKSLSGFVQRVSKVNLLGSGGQALRYSQFRNYELDTEPALKAMLAEGNGPGLKNAVNGLSAHGLDKKSDLAKALNKMKKLVSDLVDAYEGRIQPFLNAKPEILEMEKKKALQALTDQVKAVITQAEHAEGLRTQFVEQAKKMGTKSLAQTAENLQGEFKGALIKYAKVRRLPSDLVSFLAVVGLIGWFPVWFNSVWNKRQFEKEKAAREAAEASHPPVRPMPFNSFRSHTPYQPVQSSFNYAMQTPYGANPFARQ